jgi:hypothetical protein
MVTQSDAALEHYKALRAEIIERLKMRDQVLLAYLGAVAALVGFAAADANRFRTLYHPLMILMPFLALGAATCVSQHQDTITAFNEYINQDLLKQLSSPPPVFYDSSAAAHRHAPNSLWTRFVTQSVVICGPPVLLLGSAAFGFGSGEFHANWWIIGTSAALTLASEFRLWWSKHYRSKVHTGIQKSQRAAR